MSDEPEHDLDVDPWMRFDIWAHRAAWHASEGIKAQAQEPRDATDITALADMHSRAADVCRDLASACIPRAEPTMPAHQPVIAIEPQ